MGKWDDDSSPDDDEDRDDGGPPPVEDSETGTITTGDRGVIYSREDHGEWIEYTEDDVFDGMRLRTGDGSQEE